MFSLRRSKRFCWLLIAGIFGSCYLVLIGLLPAEVPYAPHDDGLFIQWAISLDAGEWLGRNYDQFTLAKGPLHSLLIAFLHRIGFDPMAGLRCLYLLAAVSFCSFVLVSSSNWLRSAALACFLFDPWMFVGTAYGLRLLREATYVPLQLIAVTASVVALDQILRGVSLRRRFWIAWLVASICFGLLLITREARIVVVVLATELLLMLLWLLWQSWRCSTRPLPWLQAVGAGLALVVCLQLPVISLAQVNNLWYSTAITNEFEEGSFKAFYQDLTSVRVPGDSVKPWVPLNQKAIHEIISLEPRSVLGKTLRNLNSGWTQFGCEQHRETCGEYAGGWMMWAWRSSLFKTFKPRTPARFQHLTRRAHADLRRLCERYPHQIHCQTGSVGYLPLPDRWGHPQGPVAVLYQAVSHLTQALVSPRSFQPLLAYGPENQEWPKAISLGIRPPAAPDRLRLRQFWQVRNLFTIGLVCRWIMFVALAVAVLRRLRTAGRCLLDPGVAFLASAFWLQLLLLSLIHVTSFDAFTYLGLVSPLLSAWIWRWIAVIQLDRSSLQS